MAVGEFTRSAARILKSKTTVNGMWKGWEIKRGVWNNYYVSYSEEFEPLILPRAFNPSSVHVNFGAPSVHRV